jgi:hypothetical protein
MKRSLVVPLMFFALIMGACSNKGSGDSVPETPEQITGVLLSIESGGFDQVESFKLKVDEHIYTVLIDPELEYGFPLSHLSEHLRTAGPVTVRLDERDGDLYALSIEDV